MNIENGKNIRLENEQKQSTAFKNGEAFIIFDSILTDGNIESLDHKDVYNDAVERLNLAINSGVRPYFILSKEDFPVFQKRGLRPGMEMGSSIVSSNSTGVLNFRLNMEIKHIKEDDLIVVFKDAKRFVFKPKIIERNGIAKFFGGVCLQEQLSFDDFEVFGAKDFSLSFINEGNQEQGNNEITIISTTQKGAFADVLKEPQDPQKAFNQTMVAQQESTAFNPENIVGNQNISGQEVESFGSSFSPELAQTPVFEEIMPESMEEAIQSWESVLEDSVLRQNNFTVINDIKEEILEELSLPDNLRNPIYAGWSKKDGDYLKQKLEKKVSILKDYMEAITELKSSFSGISIEDKSNNSKILLSDFSIDEQSILAAPLSSYKLIDELFLRKFLEFKDTIIRKHGADAFSLKIKNAFFEYYRKYIR